MLNRLSHPGTLSVHFLIHPYKKIYIHERTLSIQKLNINHYPQWSTYFLPPPSNVQNCDEKGKIKKKEKLYKERKGKGITAVHVPTSLSEVEQNMQAENG